MKEVDSTDKPAILVIDDTPDKFAMMSELLKSDAVWSTYFISRHEIPSGVA